MSILLNMENVTKWWIALHDEGHIVPGFDNKFGSEMFFVVRGTELQTQNYFKVARTEMTKIERHWNPCEDRNETESRYFMKCTEILADRELNCSVPWRRNHNGSKSMCETPADYEVISRNTVLITGCLVEFDLQSNQAAMSLLQAFTEEKLRVTLMSEGDVITATGCKPNCRRDKYTVQQMYYETLDDIPGYEFIDGKRAAKVSFCFAGAGYVEEVEYLAYDEKVSSVE